jgi:hypothetical protein
VGRFGKAILGLAAPLLVSLAAWPEAPEAQEVRFRERRSTHFVLQQQVAVDERTGPRGSRGFERDVLAVLESAHDAIRETLGIAPREAVRVIVYDPVVFDRDLGGAFRFAAAAFYDGSIHVRGESVVSNALARTLHHEFVHAALASAAPMHVYPAWLNEGLAEYFERRSTGRRHLTPGEHATLASAVHDGTWIPLADLGGTSFAGLDAATAPLAYLESYATIEHLARTSGESSLRPLVSNVRRLAGIDTALARAFRLDLPQIEQRLLDELASVQFAR